MTKLFSKYLRKINKIIANLEIRLKKNGNYENFGQKEWRDFKDKVNADDYLDYSEKADLCSRLSERIELIQH